MQERPVQQDGDKHHGGTYLGSRRGRVVMALHRHEFRNWLDFAFYAAININVMR